MRYRRLGSTGWRVSEIGFGTWGWGQDLWRGADDARLLAALRRAVEGGMNFVDTALAYGNGHSERLIGTFLRDCPERVYVATKVPPRNRSWPARGSLQEVFPADHIVKSAETSLRNLQLEQIDLLQLHVWDPSWLAQDEWYQALCRLKRDGKVGHLGVSLNDHQPDSALELVKSGRVDTLQVIYNIFDQSPEERLFPLCRACEVGIIARVPFDEGALTGGVTPETCFPKKDWRRVYFRGNRKQQIFERVQRLTSLLGEEASSLPELALQFCLHHQAVGTVIPGMRTPEHVDANLAVSGRLPLSRETVDRLREHRWDKNFYRR